jgi:hypothetical protein
MALSRLVVVVEEEEEKDEEMVLKKREILMIGLYLVPDGIQHFYNEELLHQKNRLVFPMYDEYLLKVVLENYGNVFVH